MLPTGCLLVRNISKVENELVPAQTETGQTLVACACDHSVMKHALYKFLIKLLLLLFEVTCKIPE